MLNRRTFEELINTRLQETFITDYVLLLLNFQVGYYCTITRFFEATTYCFLHLIKMVNQVIEFQIHFVGDP